MHKHNGMYNTSVVVLKQGTLNSRVEIFSQHELVCFFLACCTFQ